MHHRLKRAFSIDYRSLRLFRIGIGVALLFHTLSFLPANWDFLSDGGLASNPPVFPSLLSVSTAYGYILFLWFLLAACGINLVRNFFPRLSVVVAYSILFSFTLRTPEIFFGADQLMLVMLFWSLFLPVGRKPGDEATEFTSFASAGVLGQIAIIYVFTGFFKSFDVWVIQGLGVYNALKGDTFTSAFGHQLGNLPLPILQLSSIGVLLLERIGPFFFFSPWFFAPFRIFLFFSFALMHVLFVMSLRIGLFGFFDIVFLLLLLPGEFWRELESFRILKPFRMCVKTDRLRPLDPLIQAAAAASFLILLFWNFHTLFDYKDNFPRPLARLVRTLGLDQRWTMFSPAPAPEAGIYVAEGETVNGDKVDLFTMKAEPPLFTRPENYASRLPNSRWLSFVRSRYHGGISLKPEVRAQLANYFCQKWWRINQTRLKNFTLWYRYEFQLKLPGAYGATTPLFNESCRED